MYTHDSKLGQLAIKLLRRSSGKLWERTKPLRIWLLAVPKIKDVVRDDGESKKLDVDQKIIYSQLLSGDYGPKIKEKNSTKRVVRVLSPYSRKGQHNILNLARYYTEAFSNMNPAVLLTYPKANNLNSMNTIEGTFNKSSDNYKKSSRASIYHLGNNSESSILLQDFFKNEDTKAVVLHDLWLFDLYQHLGPLIGRSSLGFEMIQKNLGVFGTKGISEILAGGAFEENIRLEIGKLFLLPILMKADVAVIHSKDNLFSDWVVKHFLEKTIQVPLPFGYPKGDLEYFSNVGAVDTALISGKISGINNLQFYTDLIVSILSIDEIKKVTIFGEMVESLDSGSLKKKIKERNLSFKSISLIRELDDSYWDELLGPNAIGIRLGVGYNGENSGIVRDFLSSGLKVVSDEVLESFSGYPDLYMIKAGSNIHDIMHVIKNAVVAPRPIEQSKQLKDLRIQSLKAYDLALESLQRRICEHD